MDSGAGTAPDATLIAGIAAGDERALAAFYDRHAGTALGLANAMLREAADAEEVVAEAFLQVWTSAPQYDALRASPAGWLMVIVRSRALDRLRARRRHARTVDEAHRQAVASPASPPPASARVEARERRAAVQRCLAELPDAQRRVLELAYFGGLTQTEIARELQEPLGTVKTRMRTALGRLRDALGSGRLRLER